MPNAAPRFKPPWLTDTPKPKPDRSYRKGRYGSKWRKHRQRFLAEYPEHLFCQMCKLQGRQVLTYAVDHIIPWVNGATEAEQDELFWSMSNLQGLCAHCHSAKSASEDNHHRDERRWGKSK